MKKLILHSILILVLCLCWVATTVAAAKFTADEAKVLNEAQKMIQSQNYAGAANLLGDYVQKNNPSQAEFYFLLGNAQYFRKEFSRAYDNLLKAYKIDPKNGDVAQNLGSTAWELGRYGQAGQYLEAAYNLSKNPTADMCYQVAGAYFQAKQYGSAARMCQKLINNGTVYQKTNYIELSALVLVENKQGGQAKKLMQEALQRNPNKMKFWQILANVSLTQNDYVTLAMALEVSYALQPPSASKWLELANVYLYINAQARALTCFQKGYGNTTDLKALQRMAQTAFAAGLFERGIGYMDTAIANASGAERAKLYAEKGFMLYERGLWNRAIESFRAAIAEDRTGTHAECWLFIGYSQMEMNQLSAAKETFRRASEVPSIRSYCISILDMLNELYPPEKGNAVDTTF